MRDDESRALLFIVIIILLAILATFFGFAHEVANFLNADVRPMGKFLFEAFVLAIVLGGIHWWLDDSWSSIGLPIVIGISWLRFWPVLDSIARNNVYGRRQQPKFWEWVLGNDAPGALSGGFLMPYETGTPDVWYASSIIKWLVLIAIAAWAVRMLKIRFT